MPRFSVKWYDLSKGSLNAIECLVAHPGFRVHTSINHYFQYFKKQEKEIADITHNWVITGMASNKKQGTLKYVLEQQTLGCALLPSGRVAVLTIHSKFFGKANGAKPAKPQQSKLSFATKPNPEAEEQEKEPRASPQEEEHNEALETLNQKHLDRSDKPDQHKLLLKGLEEENVTDLQEMYEKDDEHELVEEDEPKPEPEPVKAKCKSHTPTKSKKRTASPEEAPASAAVEEPPAKKQRIKAAKDTKVTKDTKKATKKEPTPKTSSKAKEDEAALKAKATQPKAKGRAKKIIEEDEDEEMTALPASTKSPAAKSEDVEDDADDIASEPDAESEDEEEKPEVAAKMRKKVAESLQAASKDLYPDWKAGDPVPYVALCTTFSKIEMTTKRLEIAAHCNRFLQQVLRLTPDDLLPTILLMINKLAADYSGIELGIGESLIMKAIGESTGRSLAVIKKDQNEIGDLGMVAAKSRGNQPTMYKPKALTIRGVHESLIAIAIVEGHGSQGRKVDAIKKILSAADVSSKAGKVDITKDRGGPSEAKFIVRTLEGKLRLGLAEKTVLVALAQALVFHEVREKTGKVPSTDALAKGEFTLKSVYRFVSPLTETTLMLTSTQ